MYDFFGRYKREFVITDFDCNLLTIQKLKWITNGQIISLLYFLINFCDLIDIHKKRKLKMLVHYHQFYTGQK
jgi:hypothetical protein